MEILYKNYINVFSSEINHAHKEVVLIIWNADEISRNTS